MAKPDYTNGEQDVAAEVEERVASLWDEVEEMLKEYAEKQANDLIRFVLIAGSMNGIPTSFHELKRLLRVAGEFVARHGRPTPKAVREALEAA